MIEVIKQVKKVRQRKGYSQEVMAFELGISQAAYAKLEKNTTRLSVERLFEIAEVLETDVSELLEYENNSQQAQLEALIDRLERLLNGNGENFRGGG